MEKRFYVPSPKNTFFFIYFLGFLTLQPLYGVEAPEDGRQISTTTLITLGVLGGVGLYALQKKYGNDYERIFIDNVHEVCVPGQKGKGQCYRSKRLQPQKLQKYLKRYGIKKVVNLCSADDPKDKIHTWCKQEENAAMLVGASYVNCPINSHELPTKEQIFSLLDVYQQAFDHNESILIHCRRGADRTGIAAVLWCVWRGIAKCETAKKLQLYPRTTTAPWFWHYQWNTPKIDEFTDVHLASYLDEWFAVQDQNKSA